METVLPSLCVSCIHARYLFTNQGSDINNISLKMTTPNDQECIPAIPVDGAPGGRFYVQQNPKTTCAHCGKENEKDKMTFSCKGCLIQICSVCVGFGYDKVHEDTCQGGFYDRGSGVDKKGIIDKDIKYVCTCSSEPKTQNCTDCLVKKIKKYNCFNCDEPKKATVICGNCLNHFVCSAECHAKDMSKSHNHAKTCGKSLPVWCKHGRPILLKYLLKCNCRMCEHGMWSEDCYICIASDHLIGINEHTSKRPRSK